MRKLFLSLVLLAILMSVFASAATYWVSPTGASAWANCQGSNPLSGTSACSLATANANVVAGDTVYLRGGTYGPLGLRVYGIAPRHSGTSASNRITYAAAPGETPIITGSGCYDCGWGLVLSNVSYIKVDRIIFQNLGRWAVITNYAHHNEIVNCIFRSITGEDVVQGFFIGGWCAGGSSLACYSTHNWVHNNTFSKAHRAPLDTFSCYEGRDLVRIGDPPNPSYPPYTGDNNYNTIEDNYMEYAGHALFDTYGLYTVFRGNIMHNEAWINDTSNGTCWFPPMPNGKYGHRLMQFSEDFGRDGLYSLVENNRMGYSSANPNNPGEANFAIAAPKLIVRMNYIYGSQQAGIFFKYASYGRIGAGGTGSTNNRVYRNTIFHNGWTYPYMQGPNSYNGHTCSTCPGKLAGITIASTTLENVIKNNIVYDSFSYTYSWSPYSSVILYKGLDITVDTGRNPADFPAIATIEDNWMTGNGSPRFINPDVSNQSSKTLPDLRIQSNSPVVDHGTSLTTTVGSGGNSINLVVKDSLYFQDGSWGSDLARGVTFFPDWIAIGSVTNAVQIRSINYSTNRITLASPITWSNNAPVWLYKKSDGKVVLYGSAPDIGAYEYDSGTIMASCANDCSASGARQCSGTSSYQACGNYDTDPCLDWSGTTACATGQTCSAGNCVTTPIANWNCGTLPGDVNNDGKVDIADLSFVARRYTG